MVILISDHDNNITHYQQYSAEFDVLIFIWNGICLLLFVVFGISGLFGICIYLLCYVAIFRT